MKGDEIPFLPNICGKKIHSQFRTLGEALPFLSFFLEQLKILFWWKIHVRRLRVKVKMPSFLFPPSPSSTKVRDSTGRKYTTSDVIHAPSFEIKMKLGSKSKLVCVNFFFAAAEKRAARKFARAADLLPEGRCFF